MTAQANKLNIGECGTRRIGQIGSLLLLLCALSGTSGCVRGKKPGQADVPPDVKAQPGVYADINPRWSHDGRRIAFLRATTDRKKQLFVCDAQLGKPRALFQAELLCPDRPYSSELKRYSSPDTIAWSPDDRRLAFERIEWFSFDNGDRLPGTSLWSYDRTTGAVQPLATHPARYKFHLYYFHTPRWSPDGRYLAFMGEGVEGDRQLFLHSLIAQNPRDVTPRFDAYSDSDWPAWNGKALTIRQGIVYPLAGWRTETLRTLSPGKSTPGSARELWRIRSTRLRTLLPAHDPQIAIAPRAAHLVWSPQGHKLAFTLTPDANDYQQYALWVLDSTKKNYSTAISGNAQEEARTPIESKIKRSGIKIEVGGARRISPDDGQGYLAPVWIDEETLGALSPQPDGFQVVTLDLRTGKKQIIGHLPTSDCDWSPDRTQIVYAMPPDDTIRDGKSTTLHLLQTGLHTH